VRTHSITCVPFDLPSFQTLYFQSTHPDDGSFPRKAALARRGANRGGMEAWEPLEEEGKEEAAAAIDESDDGDDATIFAAESTA
jgi:hypothetical protein